ncbi:efflux RND transporter periplasmic adaptor subunit [Calothrix rhizosoleniae]|uniref:efflux RND transporter periplasmic adaptor subunit n=1 Tax=Calothrix rhizosoleniae TaxID=888997 RepID=UPI001F3596D9|nr:efflux RND transporter periplasmic adaptor subunit [Calothrix rhizosoleniae]
MNNDKLTQNQNSSAANRITDNYNPHPVTESESETVLFTPNNDPNIPQKPKGTKTDMGVWEVADGLSQLSKHHPTVEGEKIPDNFVGKQRPIYKSGLLWRVTLLLSAVLLVFIFTPPGRNLLRNVSLVRADEVGKKSKLKTTALARILPVQTQQVQSVNTYQVNRFYTGTVVPRRSSSFGFERSGKLEQIFVDEGNRVKAGTLLASLSTKSLKAQQRELLAKRAQLVAQLKELQAGARSQTIAAARATVRNLRSQLRLASNKSRRRQELFSQGAISQEQLDEAITNVSALQARLDEAQSQLDELLAGTRGERIEAQKASIEQLDASIASLKIELEKSTLLAPFTGKISARLVDEGTVVAVGNPVFRLVEDGVLEARIGVPVTAANKLKIGRTLPVTIGENNYSTRVLSILPELDPNTRTTTVVLTLNSQAVGKVSPGQVARLQLTETISDAGYWLPTTALVKGVRGLWSCYVLGESDKSESFATASNQSFRVEQRDVEILHNTGDRVLVRGTLQTGDQVIINGTHRLVPGQLVLPTRTPIQ